VKAAAAAEAKEQQEVTSNAASVQFVDAGYVGGVLCAPCCGGKWLFKWQRSSQQDAMPLQCLSQRHLLTSTSVQELNASTKHKKGRPANLQVSSQHQRNSN
jgi:hypothetical protein